MNTKYLYHISTFHKIKFQSLTLQSILDIALLDIDEGTDENAQWSGYKTALGNYLADSLIVSLGRSMKALATILKAAKNKPIIKTNVVLQSKVLAVSVLGKDMCLFLDSFKR